MYSLQFLNYIGNNYFNKIKLVNGVFTIIV